MDFYTVGHITNDLTPTAHVSGSVVYGAIISKTFGYQPTIITKCPPKHHYINDLNRFGINIITLPIKDKRNINKLTTFNNVFDSRGCRDQYARNIQEDITLDDLRFFPKMSRNCVLSLGLVIGEVELSLINYLAKDFDLGLICQGFFRKINQDGHVVSQNWSSIDFLDMVSFVSVSNEDIRFNKKIDYKTLDKLKTKTKITMYTLGSRGSTIFGNPNEKGEHIKPFKLNHAELIEFSGCGDVFTTAFILTYRKINNLKIAAVFASFITSLKIRANLSKNNFGPKSCPTKRQIVEFIKDNPERCNKFLHSNDIEDDNLMNKLALNLLSE